MKKIKNLADSSVWDSTVSRVSQSKVLREEILRKDFILDDAKIAANRIRLGEPVGDYWLEGRAKEQLIKDYGLKAEDFQKYI
tara:strand:- start:157 stop:402 length:246 start_codon:yes stop_codon:yes gene_type:complete